MTPPLSVSSSRKYTLAPPLHVPTKSAQRRKRFPPLHKTKTEVGLSALRFLYLFSAHTHKHTRVTETHTHTVRDPKHRNSANPLRRSLKGFLKADFEAARRLSRSALFAAAALLKRSSSTPSPFHSASSHFSPASVYPSFSLTPFLFVCPHLSSETGCFCFFFSNVLITGE